MQYCVHAAATRRHDADTSSDLDSFDESDTESGTSTTKGKKGMKKKVVMQPVRRPSVLAAPGRHHYGSFYLRMGAVGEFWCNERSE